MCVLDETVFEVREWLTGRVQELESHHSVEKGQKLKPGTETVVTISVSAGGFDTSHMAGNFLESDTVVAAEDVSHGSGSEKDANETRSFPKIGANGTVVQQILVTCNHLFDWTAGKERKMCIIRSESRSNEWAGNSLTHLFKLTPLSDEVRPVHHLLNQREVALQKRVQADVIVAVGQVALAENSSRQGEEDNESCRHLQDMDRPSVTV